MGCGTARRVTGNGLDLTLHEWGKPGKPPALLLHSMAAHGHWWDWTAPLLAERFHVVAMDFRGHGTSDHATPPAYRFDDYALDVRAVLAALGWTAPLVIGHSMGAYVASLLAATWPDRVAALVIADMLTGWTDEQDIRAKTFAERPLPRFASPEEAAERRMLFATTGVEDRDLQTILSPNELLFEPETDNLAGTSLDARRRVSVIPPSKKALAG